MKITLSKGFDALPKTVVAGKEVSWSLVSFVANNKRFYVKTSMYLGDKLGREVDVKVIPYAEQQEVSYTDYKGNARKAFVVAEIQPLDAGTVEDLLKLVK